MLTSSIIVEITLTYTRVTNYFDVIKTSDRPNCT